MNGDSAFEHVLARVFSIGAKVSTGLLALGLVAAFAAGGTAEGLGAAALRIGLIVLLATPVLTVVASSVEYARRREWFFVTVGVIVLVELAVTVIEALR